VFEALAQRFWRLFVKLGFEDEACILTTIQPDVDTQKPKGLCLGLGLGILQISCK